MRAVVDGIARWPWMNADVRGDEALIRRYVNMGMAVAIDDSKGLLVPVIKNAEQLNLVGLSRAIVDLADRARRKALEPDEMSGATFTITNPGVFGTLVGTPIIPHGSVGIIDTGALVKRPVVLTDADGNDSIAIRSMMYLSISFDHRLVDGAYAAQFMQQVKKNLESWTAEAYGA
jgi:pyruvate/2-oxoglutarate dehydrogenase complex dihydrolipoamide acyltransferase (E2) component